MALKELSTHIPESMVATVVDEQHKGQNLGNLLKFYAQVETTLEKRKIKVGNDPSKFRRAHTIYLNEIHDGKLL